MLPLTPDLAPGPDAVVIMPLTDDQVREHLELSAPSPKAKREGFFRGRFPAKLSYEIMPSGEPPLFGA